ncbi:MAG TPA: MFS transporter [bacterium]|nr:MFS transporter [bacterium]
MRIHALGLMGFGAITSIMMTIPILSLYLNDRGLSPAHVGAVIGVMSLALVVTEVLAAPAASSRLGRRATVAIALAGSAVMLTVFPQVRSLTGFYLNRLIFGGLRGLLWPVMFAEVAEQAPARREASFAVFWLYFGLGTLVGPALGGILGDRFSLTAPFFVAAAISVLTLSLVIAVRPFRDPGIGNPLAAYRRLLRISPAMPRAWALTLCNVTIFSVYSTFLPLHAASRGLSAAQIGLIFTGGAVSFILGQDLLRRFVDRIPAERLLGPAFVVRGLGIAIVPLLHSFESLLVANFLSALVGAAVPLALTTRVAALAPPDQLVPAMGGFNAAADMGFFVGPVVGGLLAVFGLGWTFGAVLPVLAISVLLLRDQHRIPRRLGEQHPIHDHGGE